MDVCGIGELLIDFTPEGVSALGQPLFSANPGGGPANLLAAVARLGGSAAFIGKVGNDGFGRQLDHAMQQAGVDMRGLVMAENAPTTLAFVHLAADGERSFSFYRDRTADISLTAEEVRTDVLKEAPVLHFSSVNMTKEPARGANLHAVQQASLAGKRISFDPNLRPALWSSLDEAKRVILGTLPMAHWLKVSEEEMEFLTGETSLEVGSAALMRGLVEVVVVTMGDKGSFFRCGSQTGYVPGFHVKAVDTTGAGDAFWGAFLLQASRVVAGGGTVSSAQLPEMLRFANAAGALTTTRKGGVPAMPDLDETRCLMQNM